MACAGTNWFYEINETVDILQMIVAFEKRSGEGNAEEQNNITQI
jgi:hypothetical protein